MPFKSDKQRRYLHANKPEVADKFAKDSMAGGGMVKKAMTNAFSKHGSMQDYARMRSGGIIKEGTRTPGDVVQFDRQCLNKFKDS